MDGAEALAFRHLLPRSVIYAFEPNPRNVRLMEASPLLREGKIEIVPAATSNYDGEGDFFVVAAEYDPRDDRRGMSSLYRRSACPPADVVRVKTIRLDTFLAARCGRESRLALWIDTEGKAWETVEGMARIADRVDLLHIEVETIPCIGSDQRLYPQVRAALQQLGFTELATDQPRSASQFNVVYLRGNLGTDTKLRAHICALRAHVRHVLFRLVFGLCPSCLRRYRSLRDRRRTAGP
jgi:FkbM family methyltransferase